MSYFVLSKGKFRRVILQNLLDFIQDPYVSKTLETVKHDKDCVKHEPYALPKHYTTEEYQFEVRRALKKAVYLFPYLSQLEHHVDVCLQAIANSDAATTYLKACFTIFAVQSDWLNLLEDRDSSDFDVEADENYLKIRIKDSEIAWNDQQYAATNPGWKLLSDIATHV
ncbi:hypothetical protein ACKFKG_13555 [Phormidesmis sp. 146-35]